MIRDQSLGREARLEESFFFGFMQVSSLIGKKIDQTQGFLEDGTRVPLSIISLGGNVVTQIKTAEKEGYNAVQVGFGTNKRSDKPTLGHFKRAGLENNPPRFLREIKVDNVQDFTPAAGIPIEEVFELGDIVDVTGTSKGKGFAGVVKRYKFAGGPRTHGQSDRERARGSSGSGTTPGRVYRGKKMAGRMGSEQVTVKNLEVLDIQDGKILVRGLVPGTKGSILVVKKVGKNKKFMPLWSEKPVEEIEVVTAEEVVATPEETVEVPVEEVKTPDEAVIEASDTVATESTSVEEKSEEVKEEVKEENDSK